MPTRPKPVQGLWPLSNLYARSSALHIGFLIFALTCSCKISLPPKQFEFIVRDGSTLELLKGALVEIKLNGELLDTLHTDGKGYALRTLKHIGIQKDTLNQYRDRYLLRWSKNFGTNESPEWVSDSVYLNRYLPLYELYLLPPHAVSISELDNPEDPTADMHYHVSMRTHNHFGKWLYNGMQPFDIPTNLNWYKSYKKLRVLYTSPKGKSVVKRIKAGDLAIKNTAKLKTILNQKWVYAPVGASNKFTEFTQATHPHVAEGNVRLAYNAISPFERGTSSNWRNRFVGSLLVTGANPAWLKRIGGVKDPMTHWDNFNYEYYNITRQSTSYNHFTYRFLNQDTDWSKDMPTIVTVLEGSHVLQDKFFPQQINFDIGNPTSKIRWELLDHILSQNFPIEKDSARNSRDDEKLLFLRDQKVLKPELGNKISERILKETPLRDIRSYLNDTGVQQLILNTLKAELNRNIDSLKRMDPPVCMVAISHLSYNGMTGHAVAWDQGRGFSNLVARRNYGIRVSDDAEYRKQWERAFYSIPGVNAYGVEVIQSLVSRKNGYRIMIDLKHSDPSTRKFFFDQVMIQSGIIKRDSLFRDSVMRHTPPGNETIRDSILLHAHIHDTFIIDTVYPICSHCGVNGLSIKYSSPLVNEYYLAKAAFVKTLYPFGINLYNEEISTICRNGGIIGIPLEQRILGGYINKNDDREFVIDRKGNHVTGKIKKCPRWAYTKRFLLYLFMNKREKLLEAIRYTELEMGVKQQDCRTDKKRYTYILDMIIKDYISVEPFLYNVFHIVDQCGLGSCHEAWKHICIGSDLDGLIDPIDVVPTASQYPQFKEKLKLYIPIFLDLRRMMDPEKKGMEHYFNTDHPLDDALDYVFYQSLYDFTRKSMLK